MLVLDVQTDKRSQIVDLTDRIRDAVKKNGLKKGLVMVYSPHTTAAVTINENTDPLLREDFLTTLDRLVPNEGFKHSEGNADSHVKTALVGQSVTLIVDNGALQLGTWQALWFCEFDGPRRRKVWVTFQGDR